MRAFDWHPGIEHVSLVAWGAAVLYLFTAYFCWRAARAPRSVGVAARSEPLVWGAIACLFVLLGLFRGAEFQPTVVDYGRDMAHIQGWYEYRHIIQPYIIGVIGIASLIAAIVLLKLLWGLPPPTQLAVGCTLMLLTYIAVRIVSLHPVDAVAHTRILGVRLSWIFEIGILVVVIFAARQRRSTVTAGN